MSLPSFNVRQSPKAKNLRLKVTPEDGLCVVVPRGFDEARIPSILKRKKEWIADALKKAKERKRFFEPSPAQHLPEGLLLQALGERWVISYRETPGKVGLGIRQERRELVLSGASFGRSAVISKLKKWLGDKVSHDLEPLARNVAEKNGFELGRVLVKSQRTRWASCSSRGNLALNTKLLFLPPELVRYVLIHELCHTVHMDHSKDFWRLVECHEPKYRVLDQQLRAAWKQVPRWLL